MKNLSNLMLSFVCVCCAVNAMAQNPFLPLWEYIPDGEPYVFEDPDNPGKQRLYIYGSHDILQNHYCGGNQVVWSAPIEDLTKWRYDGVMFEVSRDRDGKALHQNGKNDLLYAPDVTMKTLPNGKKEYYLFPNNQEKGRESMIARSDRPNGPFTVINWSENNPTQCDGILRFDPAVFVDDDGRVYGYWGLTKSFGAELDPETMCTLKKGTTVVEDMVSSLKQPGVFRFFEASSIRKIKDKYIFIYSRWTENGDFSLPGTNYTLAYAYSNNPLGPFTYGGTIIDGRARDVDPNGKVIITAAPTCNTHGSICEINGQWYVFYHRITGRNEFSRQAMVAPIEVEVKEGKDGYVRIKEGEVTSEGFAIGGLNPLIRYSAGIACWHTGPRMASRGNISGPYIIPNRVKGMEKESDVYNIKVNSNDVVHCTDGSVVGYKYYNFDYLQADKMYNLAINLTAEEKSFDLEVWVDSPWKEKGGKMIGSMHFDVSNFGNDKANATDVAVPLSALEGFKGKHALFIKFSSNVKDRSLCTLHSLVMNAK